MVTSNPDFKVTLSLDDEYLRNARRYRDIHNGILTDLHSLYSNERMEPMSTSVMDLYIAES